MAKLIEDIIVMKFSKIVRDSESDPEPAMTNDQIQALIPVAQELAGASVVVEVERA